MTKTISASDLRAVISGLLAAAGSLPAEAETVASNLVEANLSGHDSHGIGMAPRYVDAVREGGLKPNTSLRTVLDIGTMLSLDGQSGYGQVIGEQAMGLGIQRAKAHGSCIMTLANSHHLGRIGHFAEMAVAQSLVSLHFVNVMSRPIVAPWGGGDGRFGTNPCCIGIPLQGEPPFILDFATSRVAQGKMRVAYNEGHAVAPGMLIDEAGKPTTDPGVVVVPQANGLFGALLTFGEHKGFGMALACELLGGALSGGGTWHHTPDGRAAALNNMLTILIDPVRLGTQQSFAQESSAFLRWMRESPVADGFESVQIAGEPERKARVARERDGIVIDQTTWDAIVQAGAKLGFAIDAG
ncbi:MAG: malate/lactate/ureidoglycolate dehydrogenase [Burkholderiaceae bacterium]